MSNFSASARSLLRRLSRSERRTAIWSRALSSSHSGTSSLPSKGSEDLGPRVLPSDRSHDSYIAASSPSGGSGISSPFSGKNSSSIWLNESPQFKSSEQKFGQRSHHANSLFMLHPMMSISSRGFMNSGSKVEAKAAAPTYAPDGPKEEAEAVAESAKDWVEIAYAGIVDSVKSAGETVDVVTPHVKKFVEAYPVIVDISIPVSVFTGAWVILPRVLRWMHRYVEQGSTVVSQGQENVYAVAYEQSMWKAMEDPARLFATLLTCLQIGMIVAPGPVVAQYLTQFWSGGSILCVVWFLNRWKSSVLKNTLMGGQLSKEDTEKYSGLDKFSSLTLIFIGALGIAEAAGVALSSLLAVGGIGGIATAFAAREILANLLTGLTLSFSKPFTVGDSIKAGAVEGKVEVVGMFATRLLNSEKNPISVPNSFFTSQAIVNKSRAPWRALSVKIPVQLFDFEKLPSITLEVREMLFRNPHVYLQEDQPTCHIAQFSLSAVEIAIICNVKPMSKNAFLLVEEEILVDAAKIITAAGASLGGT